jgi:dUTP pyrophosphatase
MIQVKLLTENSKLPSRNTPTDAGLDLYSSETLLIRGREWKAVSAGISISIPDGYYARIAPRSGLAYKYGIDVFAGVVDSGYRGEIKAILYNAGEKDYLINIGDKIAQLIIEKCYNWEPELVENLNDSERGENGFGSSGK